MALHCKRQLILIPFAITVFYCINKSPFSQSSSELTVIWWYSGKSTHPWNRVPVLPFSFWISGSKNKIYDMWFNRAGCFPPKSPDKSITYLTKASNTYFIYALQANITIHIRRNLASKYMKIWHFDKS